MKFENIKPQDQVLIPTTISTGWGSHKVFYILSDVDRVTKTQFVAGGRRFKKDGREIGTLSWNYAYYPGDKFTGFDYTENKTAQDQTEEMRAFNLHMNQIRLVNRDLDTIPRRIKYDDIEEGKAGEAMELIRQLNILLSNK